MPDQSRKPFRGYLYIATATFFWGVCATLGRAAFTGRLPGLHAVSAIDPLILSQGRATFSFLVLLPILRLLRGRQRLRVSARDLGQLFLIGILGVAASNYFYYLAIQRANVATAQPSAVSMARACRAWAFKNSPACLAASDSLVAVFCAE